MRSQDRAERHRHDPTWLILVECLGTFIGVMVLAGVSYCLTSWLEQRWAKSMGFVTDPPVNW
jgi:hypothetical protein